MNNDYSTKLAAEIERAINAGNNYVLDNGTTVRSATEADLITHLTTKRAGYYVEGRQNRFPGIGNGLVFSGALQDAEMPKAPELDAVLKSLAELAFIVETIAHLQGREKALLPAAERARTIINLLQPRSI